MCSHDKHVIQHSSIFRQSMWDITRNVLSCTLIHVLVNLTLFVIGRRHIIQMKQILPQQILEIEEIEGNKMTRYRSLLRFWIYFVPVNVLTEILVCCSCVHTMTKCFDRVAFSLIIYECNEFFNLRPWIMHLCILCTRVGLSLIRWAGDAFHPPRSYSSADNKAILNR